MRVKVIKHQAEIHFLSFIYKVHMLSHYGITKTVVREAKVALGGLDGEESILME